MDSFLGLIDWVLTMILWVGIPVSLTFTLVHQYFENVKPDSGHLGGGGGGGAGGGRKGPGGGGDSGGGTTVGSYFKDIIKFIMIAIIAWVAIYLVRDIIPAAGSSVVGGLGF